MSNDDPGFIPDDLREGMRALGEILNARPPAKPTKPNGDARPGADVVSLEAYNAHMRQRMTKAVKADQLAFLRGEPPHGKPPPERGEPKSTTDKPARFPLMAFDDVAMSTTSFYLVKDLIPREGLVVIWGPPKCGKSFWTFDLFMHVALGWEYRSLRVKQGAVVYCVLEGAKGFKRRIAAFRKTHPKSKGAPFYLMFTPLDLIRDHKALVASIRAQLPEGVTPAAIVIDTLNRSLAGSESKDEDMAAYVRAADAVGWAFGCVVPIVHHCGHNGERPRGHSSLLGAADVLVAVKLEADNIVATVENAKDSSTGLEIVSRLVPVDLGKDEDGDPITSRVVEPVGEVREAKAAKPKAPLTKTAKNALRALHMAVGEVGEVPPASNHIPADVRPSKSSSGETSPTGPGSALLTRRTRRTPRSIVGLRLFLQPERSAFGSPTFGLFLQPRSEGQKLCGETGTNGTNGTKCLFVPGGNRHTRHILLIGCAVCAACASPAMVREMERVTRAREKGETMSDYDGKVTVLPPGRAKGAGGVRGNQAREAQSRDVTRATLCFVRSRFIAERSSICRIATPDCDAICGAEAVRWLIQSYQRVPRCSRFVAGRQIEGIALGDTPTRATRSARQRKGGLLAIRTRC